MKRRRSATMDATFGGVMIAVLFAVTQCKANAGVKDCISGWLTITEGKPSTIHCTGLLTNETVTWSVQKLNTTDKRPLGTCNATVGGCDNDTESYQLVRDTLEESTLTVFENHREILGDSLLACATDSNDYYCNIRVVHPANFSACSIYRDSETLSGSCRVDKTFSSDGDYTCQWSIKNPNTGSTNNMPSVLILTEYSDSGQMFYQGVCSFSYRSPHTNGTYTLFSSAPSGRNEAEVGYFTPQDGVFNTSLGVSQSSSTEITVANKHSNITLICGTWPETGLPYNWTGVSCQNGNTHKMCTFVPSEREKTVSCSVTFEDGPNQGRRVTASLHLNFDDSETQTSDNGDSFPVGVIGGGVGAAVVVIVVVVVVIIIWKRRAGSNKMRSEASNHDLEEHHNIAYEPADTPCEVNDAYQPAAGKSTAQKHRVDQAYEDSSLTSQDDEPGYASPDNGRHPAGYTGLASGSGFQAHPEPSMDDGLYTSVDDPTPGSLAAVPESSTHDNEYAVVDKSKKSRKQHSFQPKPAADGELYAQVNKSRPAPGGDVYAQVDKSSKRANSKPTKNNVDDGNYAEVQKPKPDLKPKPTCAVKPSPRNSSDSWKTSGGDDEYNVLTFQGQHSQSSMSPQVEQQYSHIGSV